MTPQYKYAAFKNQTRAQDDLPALEHAIADIIHSSGQYRILKKYEVSIRKAIVLIAGCRASYNPCKH